MAFRTTFSRLARHDVGEHLAKVWKAHTYTEGQVKKQIKKNKQTTFHSFPRYTYLILFYFYLLQGYPPIVTIRAKYRWIILQVLPCRGEHVYFIDRHMYFHHHLIFSFLSYKQVMKNAKEFAVEILPAFLVLYGIKAWAQNEFEQINFHHRD